MRKRILIALLAAMVLSAPALAQTSAPGQTAPGAPAATDSRARVTWDMITGNWKRFKGKIRKQ